MDEPVPSGPDETWWSPGRVPGDDGERVDVTRGYDTDADGRADTVLADDGFDLVVSTDLDGDGFADQILRIGPDGAVRDSSPATDGSGSGVLDGLADGCEAVN